MRLYLGDPISELCRSNDTTRESEHVHAAAASTRKVAVIDFVSQPSPAISNQRSGAGGFLTEGGLPRHVASHVSAHGQRGGADDFVTEGGLPCHVASLVSAHGQRSGAGGFLTGGGPRTVA